MPNPSDPKFISFQYDNINSNSFTPDGTKECVTRSFTFRNSKIDELIKLKDKTMITNATHVDVLTWFLSKCVVEAATKD
ncbi:hypothetical protein HanHA300_Chr07g0230971 [Helianthus annuus]|nr:hypothetical protein HanHA300_Chr07g0230971 [Helianthus annuus]KAJ0555499.1 hypothetical protein HanIR_Chr07g0302751 [Helianthus annuus]KAJ0562171.1 hypothetical protein HanHA89_Chr07g0248121 [Helianthus annuus]KAJ0727544.1 hypothetical protein HanLR1_Chr07g0230931 [Helianthus annuus]KAJ0730339.1 hypothetical protein HanOQP8_Chr07g0238811 [Helianthus annuus]